MAEHNELGKLGEEIAFDYLLAKGYRIMFRNWRFAKDEIDIIAKDGEELVIVEVKTRSTDYFGGPETFVTKKKQGFLIRAADNFVQKYSIDFEVRFDVISIIINENEENIQHIEDAFGPCF